MCALLVTFMPVLVFTLPAAASFCIHYCILLGSYNTIYGLAANIVAVQLNCPLWHGVFNINYGVGTFLAYPKVTQPRDGYVCPYRNFVGHVLPVCLKFVAKVWWHCANAAQVLDGVVNGVVGVLWGSAHVPYYFVALHNINVAASLGYFQ